MRARSTRYRVPGWGVGELWTADETVLAHEFAFGREDSDADAGAGDPWAGALVTRIQGFFAGESTGFDDVPLALDWATPFQRAVAATLRNVPRGEVVSYGELAALAGYPRAGRAVGSFCAQNRFLLFVPCHRVVAAGGIGGYGSTGVGVKRRLLALEGVSL